MKRNPLLPIVGWIALSGTMTYYDTWTASTFGGESEDRIFILALSAALSLIWFNDFESKNAYWGTVAIAIVAVFVSIAFFGGTDSGFK